MLFEVLSLRVGLLIKKMKIYIHKVRKVNESDYGGLLGTLLMLSSQLVLMMILECCLKSFQSEMDFWLRK
jgi:hypothetical protein